MDDTQLNPRLPASAAAMLAIAAWMAIAAYAQDAGPREGQSAEKEGHAGQRVKKVGKDSYKIGKVTIDSRRREIRIPAVVNMNDGLIEVFLSTPVGKLHESLLVSEFDPLDLHLALLLLGADSGRNPSVPAGEDPKADERSGPPPGMLPGTPVVEKDAVVRPGTIVQVRVEWKKGEEKVSLPAEELVRDRVRKTSMKTSGWVFLGSKTDSLDGKDAVYAARLYGSVITTFHDPLAVLDNPEPTSLDDTLFIVNEKTAPSKGTEVEVVITVQPEKNDAGKNETGGGEEGREEKK